MASYRENLERDLDRWIAAGLVPGESRAAILASVPAARRLDAATALGMVGAVLFGAAVIALVAANWDAMSRMVRFALVLGAFAAACGAAAWAAHTHRPTWTDALLTVAALIFAAAIGLTGQIFDIVGEPRTALYLSAAVAAGLGLAGRSIGAMIAALGFAGLADFDVLFGFGGAGQAPLPLTALLAPAGGALAWRWKSSALAHASAIGIIVSLLWFATRYDENAGRAIMLIASFVLALLAAGARTLLGRDGLYARTFYGWFAWGALAFFALAGLGYYNESQLIGVAHRVIWIGAAIGLIALGRFDQHGWVTTSGVLGLIGGVFAILVDLGLDLISAGVIFLVLSGLALVAGRAMRPKPSADKNSRGEP